jgi:hypothetical protein
MKKFPSIHLKFFLLFHWRWGSQTCQGADRAQMNEMGMGENQAAQPLYDILMTSNSFMGY